MQLNTASSRDYGQLPYIFIVAGAIGTFASFILTYDKIQLASNASYAPSCNISPILSCGSVMNTAQATIFGAPNTLFGLIIFTALLTFGTLLASGARVTRTIWLIAQIAATFGIVFMHYLFLQSAFVLNTICPWCFIIWMITIPTFWYTTLYSLKLWRKQLPLRIQNITPFLHAHHGDILLSWYVIIIGVLLYRFWFYWVTLI